MELGITRYRSLHPSAQDSGIHNLQDEDAEDVEDSRLTGRRMWTQHTQQSVAFFGTCPRSFSTFSTASLVATSKTLRYSSTCRRIVRACARSKSSELPYRLGRFGLWRHSRTCRCASPSWRWFVSPRFPQSKPQYAQKAWSHLLQRMAMQSPSSSFVHASVHQGHLTCRRFSVM